METCAKCPLPRRCLSADRCIVYKEGAVAPTNPEPKPVPVKTSFGIGMTGAVKKALPKTATAKKSTAKKKAK